MKTQTVYHLTAFPKTEYIHIHIHTHTHTHLYTHINGIQEIEFEWEIKYSVLSNFPTKVVTMNIETG